jgi:hypothetical protein
MVFRGGLVFGRHVVGPECVFQRRVGIMLVYVLR